MQITKAEVTPVELKLKKPVQMAGLPLIKTYHRHLRAPGDAPGTERLGLYRCPSRSDRRAAGPGTARSARPAPPKWPICTR